jgi:cytochrome c oxidase assembly protein subunit 15
MVATDGRELGETAAGAYLPFAALTAIHVSHRVMAFVVLVALALLAWRLHATAEPSLRRFALGLALLGLWQLVSGLSNVVLGWPIVAAIAHTGGAAIFAIVLASLLARAHGLGSASRLPAAQAGRPLAV